MLRVTHVCAMLLVSGLCSANCQRSCVAEQPTTTQQATAAVSRQFAWQPGDGKLSLVDGQQPVLEYVFRSGSKPIVYPLVGPGGTLMTRDYPMQSAPQGGTTDHPHHRSLWLTHGEVNNVDFWLEGKQGGQIVHREITQQETSTDSATLGTVADWVTPAGEKLLTEERTMIVRGEQSQRQIEFRIKLTATAPSVHFGDTKEGSFGLRVPDSMAVDTKAGGVILNEHGERDDAAWGKRSRWVDYSGPVNGKTVGMTLFDHPSSYGHPCRWHVRTYGLFAANPFGQYHFIGGQPSPGLTLKQGETLDLRYLLWLHEGHADTKKIEGVWKEFASAK